MELRFVLLLTTAAMLMACSGDRAPAGSTANVPGAGTATPIPVPDIEDLRPTDLIYWESFFNYNGDAGPRREAILAAIGEAAQDDPRYRAFLIELALYPSPYREQAWQLLDLGDEFDAAVILDTFSTRGFLTPEDDLDTYVDFKAVLLDTIYFGLGQFLDRDSPRNISAQEVIWGGVTIDGIPPLNDPAFVTAQDAADWIFPSDHVIGIEINGDARAYPRRIIDWHEMVNDTVGGVPVSLAYCTLCGSAILYDGRVGDEVLRFGTSGLLYRSNKLMYDTTTRTLWEQYTGEPAWGELVGSGVRLEVLPAVHTTWAEWLDDHPETKVLDIETGFERDYGSGVAYADYWASPELRFPAPDLQGPLDVKDVVYTVRLGPELVAYPIELVTQRGFVEDVIAGRDVIVIASSDGSGARAYDRGGASFTAADLANDTLTDTNGEAWQVTETALVGPDDATLERLPGHNSFWFAVVNHAPNWRLYQE